MKLIRVLVFCVVGGLVATSGTAFAEKAAPKPTERAEVSKADAEKFLAFFEKFVDAVVANKDDCAKMAGAINAVIDAHADVIKMANEAKAAKKRLPKDIEDKMMLRVKEMTPAMQKCGKDKKVKDAVGRLAPKKSKK